MRAGTPKMLDFLGWLRRRRLCLEKASKLSATCELDNVDGGGKEVK
jgi:hypothetical protein